jgi:hypothetical protein
MRFARLTFVLICLLLPVTCYSQNTSPAIEKRVAVLIEKMVKEKSEHWAFADLEAAWMFSRSRHYQAHG